MFENYFIFTHPHCNIQFSKLYRCENIKQKSPFGGAENSRVVQNEKLKRRFNVCVF